MITAAQLAMAPPTTGAECEWNPELNVPAQFSDERHAATLSVGVGKNNWHLCARCAAMPRFKRYRVRKQLRGT